MSRNLPAGQCILINSNVIHSTKCTHPNRAIVLQIPIEFMETYIPEVSQLLFLWNPETQDPIMRTKLDRMKDTLTQVFDALREKGYNPINQIVGYLLSEDPTYITTHNNARSLIRRIDRDELLAAMVKSYLD